MIKHIVTDITDEGIVCSHPQTKALVGLVRPVTEWGSGIRQWRAEPNPGVIGLGMPQMLFRNPEAAQFYILAVAMEAEHRVEEEAAFLAEASRQQRAEQDA